MEYLIYAIIAWIIWKLFFSKKIFKKRLGMAVREFGWIETNPCTKIRKLTDFVIE